MDYDYQGYGYQDDAIESSYYEYKVKGDRANDIVSLKQKVFHAMDSLEGWCSKEKASILIDLVCTTRPQVAVEIGVFGGKSMFPVAFAMQYNGSGKIYGVDPWSPGASVVGQDGVNHTWWAALDHEKIYQGVISKTKEFGLSKYVELRRTTSEACPPIANIDILHIDGNHSEQTSYIDVTKWVPLVRSGGLVIFDDIGWGGGTNDTAIQWLNANCMKSTEYKGDNVWGIWIKP